MNSTDDGNAPQGARRALADMETAARERLGPPIGSETQAEIASSPTARQSIEGVIEFMRGEPSTQLCCCCPPGTGHVFARNVRFDHWDGNVLPQFGNGESELLYSVALNHDEYEGRRVRVTVEVLDKSEEST